MINNDYPNQSTSGDASVTTILIGFLGVGFVLFAVLSLYAFSTAHTATATLTSQKQAAASAAAEMQKKTDAAAVLNASESPFRPFTAAADFGGFVINFPKNWSGAASESTQTTNQVVLTLNPDFVRQTNGIANPLAAKVVLVQQLTSSILTQLSSQIKIGRLQQQDVMVSGIKGTQLTGAFDDKVTVREVLVPVRDKTIIFSTEDAKYSSQFDQILAQAKINP